MLELSDNTLSSFVVSNFTRPLPDFPTELEFYGPTSPAPPDAFASFVVRKNYQRPGLDKATGKAYAACRRWQSDTASANVKITVNLHAVPGKCSNNAGMILKLIKNDQVEKPLLNLDIPLLKEGDKQPLPEKLEHNVITSLPLGTVLELCLEPRERVCEGMGVRMVVNRHGPSRRKEE